MPYGGDVVQPLTVRLVSRRYVDLMRVHSNYACRRTTSPTPPRHR